MKGIGREIEKTELPKALNSGARSMKSDLAMPIDKTHSNYQGLKFNRLKSKSKTLRC